MHFIKHDFEGVHAGRWYQVDEGRFVQFTIQNTAHEYRFLLTKGYGEKDKAPRSTKVVMRTLRGELRAAVKDFNRNVKICMSKYPGFTQNLENPLPEKPAEQGSLKLVEGMG